MASVSKPCHTCDLLGLTFHICKTETVIVSILEAWCELKDSHKYLAQEYREIPFLKGLAVGMSPSPLQAPLVRPGAGRKGMLHCQAEAPRPVTLGTSLSNLPGALTCGPHVVRTRTSQGEALLKEDEVHGRTSPWPQGSRQGLDLLPESALTPDDLSEDSPTLPPACLPALPGPQLGVTSCSHTVPPPFSPCAPPLPSDSSSHLAAILG